jgi:DNA-binding Lrp family transcriptional regulator
MARAKNSRAPSAHGPEWSARSADRGVQAFILVEAKAGKAMAAAKQIGAISGVLACYAVTGPFDVIVHTEAPDIKSLGQLVVAKMQALPGVTRTLTCIVIEATEAK